MEVPFLTEKRILIMKAIYYQLLPIYCCLFLCFSVLIVTDCRCCKNKNLYVLLKKKRIKLNNNNNKKLPSFLFNRSLSEHRKRTS